MRGRVQKNEEAGTTWLSHVDPSLNYFDGTHHVRALCGIITSPKKL